MVTKLEVGKFYSYRDNTDKECARECLYVNENGFLLGTNEKGVDPFFFNLNTAKFLVEYRPPVVHKAYLQWIRLSNGAIFARISSLKWNPKEYSSKLLSETEVTYTEE